MEISEKSDELTSSLKTKTAQLAASKEEVVILRTRIKDLEELHNQQEGMVRKLRKQMIDMQMTEEV